MKSYQACTGQIVAGCVFALLSAAVACAGPPGFEDISTLVFDPLSIVKPATGGRGPSFLSIEVGRSGKQAVELTLGPPSRVDSMREVVLWRRTHFCTRYDLEAVALRYSREGVVEWMELVLRNKERVAAAKNRLHLGQPTETRQEDRWTVYRYAPAGVELITEQGNVGTIKLFSPRQEEDPPSTRNGRFIFLEGPLVPLRKGTKKRAPSYGQIHLLRPTKKKMEAMLGRPDRASSESRSWWEGGAFCKRHSLKRIGVLWQGDVIEQFELDLAVPMARSTVLSRLQLGKPSTRRPLKPGYTIEFYGPEGIALGLKGNEAFAVMLVSSYVESSPQPGRDGASAEQTAEDIAGSWAGRFVHAENVTGDAPITLDVSEMDPLGFTVTHTAKGYVLTSSMRGETAERELVRQGAGWVTIAGPPLTVRHVDEMLVMTLQSNGWRFEAHATRVD